jgi:exodeoxyribonuclease-3
MKIITWNCNMAYRKKANAIMVHLPDIVIVQECECPENLKFAQDVIRPNDVLWFGTNKHKGLGIFSYSNYRFKVIDTYNPALKTIVPILVTDSDIDFILFAIWANNPQDPEGQYVEQVWKAIKHYDKLLGAENLLLIGDFNSNTIWDKKHREGNHSNVVKHLAERDIHSLYHTHHGQIQGQEQHPTFYLYRHQNKPYHLDYCFGSGNLEKRLKSVEVCEHEYWNVYSDHVPMIFDFY